MIGACVDRIAGGDHSEKYFVETGNILSAYQEQPELIDPVLSQIVQPLMKILEAGVNGDNS